MASPYVAECSVWQRITVGVLTRFSWELWVTGYIGYQPKLWNPNRNIHRVAKAIAVVGFKGNQSRPSRAPRPRVKSLQGLGALGGIEYAEAVGVRSPCEPRRAAVRGLDSGARSAIKDPRSRASDTAWSEVPGFGIGSDPGGDFDIYQSTSSGELVGGLHYTTTGGGALPGVHSYLSPSAPLEGLSLPSIYVVP